MATQNSAKKSRFTSPDLSEFYAKLIAKRQALQKTEKALERVGRFELSSENTGELSKVRLHSADLGSDASELEVVTRLSEREIHEIQEIEEAILRIDRGTYGYCENCDAEIPLGRLEAIPESRYCAACERAEELGNHVNRRIDRNSFFLDSVE